MTRLPPLLCMMLLMSWMMNANPSPFYGSIFGYREPFATSKKWGLKSCPKKIEYTRTKKETGYVDEDVQITFDAQGRLLRTYSRRRFGGIENIYSKGRLIETIEFTGESATGATEKTVGVVESFTKTGMPAHIVYGKHKSKGVFLSSNEFAGAQVSYNANDELASILVLTDSARGDSIKILEREIHLTDHPTQEAQKDIHNMDLGDQLQVGFGFFKKSISVYSPAGPILEARSYGVFVRYTYKEGELTSVVALKNGGKDVLEELNYKVIERDDRGNWRKRVFEIDIKGRGTATFIESMDTEYHKVCATP